MEIAQDLLASAPVYARNWRLERDAAAWRAVWTNEVTGEPPGTRVLLPLPRDTAAGGFRKASATLSSDDSAMR